MMIAVLSVDVSDKGEIRRAIHDGMWTLTEIKRYIRPGMGLCQGTDLWKTGKEYSGKGTGNNTFNLKEVTARTPNRPVELSIYRKGMMHYE